MGSNPSPSASYNESIRDAKRPETALEVLNSGISVNTTEAHLTQPESAQNSPGGKETPKKRQTFSKQDLEALELLRSFKPEDRKSIEVILRTIAKVASQQEEERD